MISKFILAFFFFLAAADSVFAGLNTPPDNLCVHKSFRPPPFHSIQAIGDVDIQIDTGACQYEVMISGRLKNAQAIKFQVRNSILSINTLVQNRSLGRTKVKICMPVLEKLVYAAGCGNITVNCIRSSCPLSLDIRGNPRVHICGNIIPGKMIIGGRTQMSIYWINACDFYFKAMDHAKVCIAGSVNTFSADASESAWINARYVRAKRAFVKSYDQSRIDLRAGCSLSTFAAQKSVIYYYQYPHMQAPFVQGAGSVIPMISICYPPCSDCDGACCKNSWH